MPGRAFGQGTEAFSDSVEGLLDARVEGYQQSRRPVDNGAARTRLFDLSVRLGDLRNGSGNPLRLGVKLRNQETKSLRRRLSHGAGSLRIRPLP